MPGEVNSKVCNTVIIDSSIVTTELGMMIDNLFKLVVSKMAKEDKQPIILQGDC